MRSPYSRCAMVSSQLYQSSFHDESCSGCQIRDLTRWVIVEQFILDSLRLLVQIQWGFQLLLSNGTSAPVVPWLNFIATFTQLVSQFVLINLPQKFGVMND